MIRTLFFQAGKLLGQSGVVFIVAFFFNYFNVQKSWEITFFILSALLFLIFTYHTKFLPKAKNVRKEKNTVFLNSFSKIITEFLSLPYLFSTILFTFVYNLPEAQLMKIVPLFLLDDVHHGGLGISLKEVGFLYGSLATLAMVAGILCSGFLLTKFSIRKLLLPITFIASLSNLGYFMLSFNSVKSLALIGIVITTSQFLYGFSNGIYMLLILNLFTQSSLPMSMYTIGSSVMGFGFFVGGAISGYLQSILGYSDYFLTIVVSGFLIFTICLLQKNYDSLQRRSPHDFV